ncbi:ADP-ribosyl-(dinitrogen reductase) hydrolase [Spongiibacter sp. KMU-158]|uniref:ADP-ribosyl-(Dinitrogen reductase) hydrolase n=1 Tax=Spongiibacter pelagi TaxID=2760804 RepID=A0A927C5K0_9GAMM|nr:ADP-ribosyl-(dinitrogen reductase) hydrolase [Spongiibacter pelagi]MBD2859976.1 ADP-ribosyl-(dinitrogen reductase) hydrolase [Spongiibacter pelagi]
MALVISTKIMAKLKDKHCVTKTEVLQCFSNINGEFLIDSREEHQTDPPSQWFIAETDQGRKLKVVFVFKDGDFFLKTAYPANSTEISIYKNKAQ